MVASCIGCAVIVVAVACSQKNTKTGHDWSLKAIDVVKYIYIMLCLLQNLLLQDRGGLGHVQVCGRVVIMACWHGWAYGPCCIIIVQAAGGWGCASYLLPCHLCAHWAICVVVMSVWSSCLRGCHDIRVIVRSSVCPLCHPCDHCITIIFIVLSRVVVGHRCVLGEMWWRVVGVGRWMLACGILVCGWEDTRAGVDVDVLCGCGRVSG